MTQPRAHIAVVGAGACDEPLAALAAEVGRGVARRGAVLVCGGLGGVMEAACRGARELGGATIGLLPGLDRAAANAWVEVALPTGLGEGRNLLVVRAADAVIAVGGEFGTLSEIALALKLRKPVVGLRTWRLARPDGPVKAIIEAQDPGEAVEKAFAAIAGAPARR